MSWGGPRSCWGEGGSPVSGPADIVGRLSLPDVRRLIKRTPVGTGQNLAGSEAERTQDIVEGLFKSGRKLASDSLGVVQLLDGKTRVIVTLNRADELLLLRCGSVGHLHKSDHHEISQLVEGFTGSPFPK